MRVFSDHSEVGSAFAGGAIAIGNFDGMHRGHQALFAEVRAHARAAGTVVGALTFAPHPVRFLAPDLAPPLLMTEAQKEAALASQGVDVALVQRFDRTFADLSPEAFVRDVLIRDLQVAHVVVGRDFNFGKRGAGKTDLLERELKAVGAELHVVEPVREGNLICSSTKVREFLREGRPGAATLLLGRPYAMSGRVVGGDQRGRELGIRTANLESDNELVPEIGVYACFASGARLPRTPAVTNVGLRPTFDGKGVRIETHLLDFAGDLYESVLTVEFVERLREERKFESAAALQAQIREDITRARDALAQP